MAIVDKAVLPLAVMVAVEGSKSFNNYLPPLATIREAGPGDEQIRADVHVGEIVAAAQIVVISASLAVLADSAKPLYVGAGAFLFMFVFYEWVLRRGQVVT